jgi:hypothetical protein
MRFMIEDPPLRIHYHCDLWLDSMFVCRHKKDGKHSDKRSGRGCTGQHEMRQVREVRRHWRITAHVLY